jgi:transcriptional regulator of aroF, aroG, tyrA and aromatic amino acid transport
LSALTTPAASFLRRARRSSATTTAQLIPGFNFQRWLDSNPQNTHSEHVVINGQNFLMEITPVYLKGKIIPAC